MLQECTWAVLAVEVSLPFVHAVSCRRLLAHHCFHYSVLHKMKGPCEFHYVYQGSDRPKHTNTQLYSLKRGCSAVSRLLHTGQTNVVIKQDCLRSISVIYNAFHL